MACGQGMGAMASPCKAGCGMSGPARNVILADRVSSSRYANGQVVTVQLKGIQPKDAQGRIAHVVGFEIRGDFDITVPGATNGAITGYDMLSCVKEFFLKGAGGWAYLNGGIDGRDLLDDMYTRNWQWSNAMALPSDLSTNAGAATYARDLHLFYPFTRLDPFNPSMRGAIPLAALQARSDAFRFTVANGTFATNPTDAPFDGFSRLDVWLHVVYLPGVWIDPGWQLESYTMADQSGILRHADRRHEYISIRPHTEDSYTLSGYDGVTIEAAGNVIASALATSELVEKNDTGFVTDLSVDLPTWGYSTEGVTDAPGGYMVVNRSKSIKAAPAGPVSFNFASRSDSSTRWLHRTVPCHGDSVGKPTLRAVTGCTPANAKGYQYDEVTKQPLPAETADPEAPIVVTHFNL